MSKPPRRDVHVHKAPSEPRAAEPEPDPGLVPDADTMRRLGYEAVDHVVARWVGLEEDRPWQGAARSRTEPLLHDPPPEEGADLADLMERAVREVFPLAGRIDHPRFLGFVPSGPGWPAVLADILVSGHNVFQGTWLESAGPSQIELTVLEWFREWIGMPDGAGGVLTSGGSAANLLAVVTAREVAGWPQDPVIYLSDQGHSSLRRAARVAGFRPHQVQVIPTGPDRRLDPVELAGRIEADREAGRTPILICANGGATNTGTVDPLEELADVAAAQEVHLHVDAAYGGFAALTPEGRAALAGLGRADSVTLDPHKWFFQTYECGCLMVRDTEELEAAFRISAEYLQDTALKEREVNFGDRGVQLTRSFRALKIWLTVQSVGRRRLARAIGLGIELGGRVEGWIREHPDFELLHPATLGIVCFRYRPGGSGDDELEELNTRIQDRLLELGDAMLSSTRLDGRYSLRFCILNHRTRWRHLEYVLERIAEEGRSLAAVRDEVPR
jgi:aromatic-L-amino-acid/L-tryptophan decarboxylase